MVGDIEIILVLAYIFYSSEREIGCAALQNLLVCPIHNAKLKVAYGFVTGNLGTHLLDISVGKDEAGEHSERFALRNTLHRRRNLVLRIRAYVVKIHHIYLVNNVIQSEDNLARSYRRKRNSAEAVQVAVLPREQKVLYLSHNRDLRKYYISAIL